MNGRRDEGLVGGKEGDRERLVEGREREREMKGCQEGGRGKDRLADWRERVRQGGRGPGQN